MDVCEFCKADLGRGGGESEACGGQWFYPATGARWGGRAFGGRGQEVGNRKTAACWEIVGAKVWARRGRRNVRLSNLGGLGCGVPSAAASHSCGCSCRGRRSCGFGGGDRIHLTLTSRGRSLPGRYRCGARLARFEVRRRERRLSSALQNQMWRRPHALSHGEKDDGLGVIYIYSEILGML